MAAFLEFAGDELSYSRTVVHDKDGFTFRTGLVDLTAKGVYPDSLW